MTRILILFLLLSAWAAASEGPCETALIPPGPRYFKALRFFKDVKNSGFGPAQIQLHLDYGQTTSIQILPDWASNTLGLMAKLPNSLGGPKFAQARDRMGTLLIFSVDPKFVNYLFSHPSEFERVYSPLSATVGPESFFLMQDFIPEEHQNWERAHKAIVPYFTPKAIASDAIPATQSFVRDTLSHWDQEKSAGGLIGDIQSRMNYVSAAIGARTLFDIDISPDEVVSMRSSLDQVFKVFQAADVAETRNHLLEISKMLVTRFRESPHARDSLLANLVRMRDSGEVNDAWLDDQVITLLFASQETTRSLLTWSVYRLAQHPEYQKVIRAEYRVLAKNPETLIGPSFLDQFVDEVLRADPIVPILQRVARQDISFGSYRIPRGATVIAAPVASHSFPALWGLDASGFRPGRFSSEPPCKGTYFPFGSGPRICTGWVLAKTETKILLGELASRYELRLEDGFQPQRAFGGTFQMKNELRVYLTSPR